jgi:outer membrane protein assembly factor BamB
MATSAERQQSARPRGWFSLTVIAGLILACGALTVYHLLTRDRWESDPEAMQRLATTPLTDVPHEAKGDWPQWRGPYRDGVSAETGLLTKWPDEGPQVLWRADAGTGFSGVSVAAGRAYTLVQYWENGRGREAVVCWDAAARGQARELWRYAYDCDFKNDHGGGPRSTPTVAGGRVYAVGAAGIFHCLKADSGEQIWKHDLLEEFQAPNLRWGMSFSPLVDGELIYTNAGGPGGHSVVAFHTKDGSVAWHALDDPAGYSSPILSSTGGKHQVLFFTGAALVSLDPKTGRENWRFPWKTDFGCNIATPIAVGNYVFISSGYGKGCALLEVRADGPHRVYESNRMCNHFSSSVYHQEYLYGFNEGTLTCMNFRTGEVRWKERGFKKGSLILADGHLIVLGESGKLALAKATPEGYVEETAYQFPSSKGCWTAPSLADGVLYVRLTIKRDDGKEEGQVIALKVK